MRGKEDDHRVPEGAASTAPPQLPDTLLAEAPWNHGRLNQKRLQFLRHLVDQEHARQTNGRKVTFLIVDDTNSICKPSTNRMERLDFHYAHSEGKSVWSHVVVTLYVVTGGLAIP